MSAHMKAFFDGAGGHWQKGSLMGLPAGFTLSTGTQNGGQETTALTAVTQLAHLGMLFVPSGYCHPALQFSNEFPHGGSPYCPSTLAGPTGASVPREEELEHARVYGEYFGKTVKALKIGREAVAAVGGGAGSS